MRRPALNPPTMKRRVAALGFHRVAVDCPFDIRIDDRHVGRGADAERAALDFEQLGWAGGQGADQPGPGQDFRFDQGLDEQRQRRFQADDPHRRFDEAEFLVVVAVRGVVGDEAVDRAVGQAGQAGVDVGPRAERRIHLVVRVVGRAGVLGQQQVMRADLGADALAGGFGPADQLDRAGGADVGDVVADAGGRGQADVALGHDFLGRGRDAGQAEAGGGDAAVHDALAGERLVLAMLDEERVEHGRVLHGPQADAGLGDAVAVVGDGDRAGAEHQADLGEFLAGAGLGDRADGVDLAGGGAGLAADEFDLGVGVEGRDGVGHAGDGGEAARDRGRAAGLDGLAFLLAGLAEVDVHVDQAGADDSVFGVDGAVGGGAVEALADGGDLAVAEGQIGGFVAVGRGVDDAGAGDEDGGHGGRIMGGGNREQG